MSKENMNKGEVLQVLQDLCKNNQEAKKLLDDFTSEYSKNISDTELITKSYYKLKAELESFEDFKEKADILEKLESLKTLL